MADGPPARACLIASMSWLLRMRVVPAIPISDATCCSSASLRVVRPPPRGRVDRPFAGASEEPAVSAVAVSVSVLSVNEDPSLSRTGSIPVADVVVGRRATYVTGGE